MKIAIITEGIPGTGYGHLTRCLSIYQAFEEKGIAPLYIANYDEDAKKFIPGVNLLQLDWLKKPDELLNTIKHFDIAVIDSYLAPIEIYQSIYKNVKKAVYLDDYIRLNYPPGIIVNGTIGAENLPYKKDADHQYILGVQYIPLRKEFWDVEVPERKNREVKNILITFGAQDSRNLTPKVLESLLNEFPVYNYHVVTSNNNIIKRDNIKIYSSLNAGEMLKLMLDSDLAVTAAGQTTYELARTGVPFVAVGVIENQKYNLTGWIEKGYLKNSIWYNDENFFSKINSSIEGIISDWLNNLIFIDGQGARKIVNTFNYNN